MKQGHLGGCSKIFWIVPYFWNFWGWSSGLSFPVNITFLSWRQPQSLYPSRQYFPQDLLCHWKRCQSATFIVTLCLYFSNVWQIVPASAFPFTSMASQFTISESFFFFFFFKVELFPCARDILWDLHIANDWVESDSSP